MHKALAIQKEVMRILGTDEVYLVGGSVRDLVMGKEPKDYDFCTAMLPDEMENAIRRAGRRPYIIGKKFGTLGFKVAYREVPPVELQEFDQSKVTYSEVKEVFEYVEVTTFRSEVYTSKSRKPEVQFVPSLEEDLARRDFTMNAMILRPDGSIYDPYGGRLDMHAKQIKTVGLPKERIMEDPLRMLRAARFAARYGYKIDPNFIGKARHLADRIYDVSIERWVQELDKLFTSDYWKQGVTELFQMGLLYRIFPEYTTANDFLRNLPDKYNKPDEAWKGILMNLDEDNIKVARYMASGLCVRFKFSNDRTDYIIGKK